MKRIHFLLSLVGLGAVAKAQVPMGQELKQREVYHGFHVFNLAPAAWSQRKPDNNQCPVCGLSEKPIIAATPSASWNKDCLTRCAHCNAAFFRDAE